MLTTEFLLVNSQLLTKPVNTWPERPVVWDSDYHNLDGSISWSHWCNWANVKMWLRLQVYVH